MPSLAWDSVKASTLALCFRDDVARVVVAEAMCADTRELSAGLTAFVELSGRGKRLVWLVFDPVCEGCTGVSPRDLVDSDFVTYVLVHMSCFPLSSPTFHFTAAATKRQEHKMQSFPYRLNNTSLGKIHTDGCPATFATAWADDNVAASSAESHAAVLRKRLERGNKTSKCVLDRDGSSSKQKVKTRSNRHVQLALPRSRDSLIMAFTRITHARQHSGEARLEKGKSFDKNMQLQTSTYNKHRYGPCFSGAKQTSLVCSRLRSRYTPVEDALVPFLPLGTCNNAVIFSIV